MSVHPADTGPVPPDAAPTLVAERFAAIVLDLDGVVTRTATTHSAAWKRMFDDFLKQRAEKTDTPFRPFDADQEYRRYVDGRPRYDGVRTFLEARGIALPDGSAEDPHDAETICGLGNRKNAYFQEEIERHGVEVFDSTIERIETLRTLGLKTAIVSSSKNCKPILEAAGLTDLFDTRVDGVVSADLGLPGKPAPDIFLEACRRLCVTPRRAVMVEDAIAGVEAGRNGAFGLVIGIARGDDPAALRDHGADIVVGDMAEIELVLPDRPLPRTIDLLRPGALDRSAVRPHRCSAPDAGVSPTTRDCRDRRPSGGSGYRRNAMRPRTGPAAGGGGPCFRDQRAAISPTSAPSRHPGNRLLRQPG